jgi:ABC-type sugar transport system ATPase subunit
MNVPRLRMTGIHKDFGSTAALCGVSLAVAPGEVHALIGEGAGKSTLMKSSVGPAAGSGRIELDGERFVPATRHARRAGSP